MWGNYLTVTFRNLAKHRTYTLINILGLAIGLAACLLLLLYVKYETSYDRWLPEYERVFQVQTFGTDPGTGERSASQGVTQPLSTALASGFPGVEAVSKLETDDIVVLRGGEAIPVEAGTVDAGFFSILQIPFIEGDRRSALTDTDSVVLSRDEAMKLFGATDVVGETLTTMRDGERHDLRVTGVFENLPRNSHMDLNMIRRFTTAEAESCPWGCVNGSAYVKLLPGAKAEDVNAALPAWEQRNVPVLDLAGAPLRAAKDWRLVNVADVHLGEAQDGARPGNDRATLATFAIIALLILGMGCVNFVNLATARASQRAREVAVRKVLGAKRSQLVAQFLGESTLLVGVAMLMALALLELTLLAFGRFLDADLDIQYLGAGGLLWPILGLLAIVGLAGGLYPALYLSGYKPGAVLKANKSTSEPQGSGRLRNALVVAQFAVSIGLIACTAIVYQQTMFARSADPGFQREGLIVVDGLRNPAVAQAREAIAREISAVEGVEGVAATRIAPADGPTFHIAAQVPGRATATKIGFYSVEPGFFETMQIPLLAGRALVKSFAKDNITIETDDPAAAEAAARAIAARGFNVVLNEAGARVLGFGTPAAAIGKQVGVPAMGEEFGVIPATVVGVVKDSRFRTIREPIEPMLYYDEGSYRSLVVRFAASDPAALRDRIGAAWRRMLPEVPFEASFAEDHLAELYGADAARSQTFGSFALLAILIATLGLFGLAAFTAERRTREIGIRKVFGATVRDIVKLLTWQFSKPVVLANIIAWPVAWWLMRDWLNTFDARIALTPTPFVLAGLIALGIAVVTVAGHALRVARVHPIHALRYE